MTLSMFPWCKHKWGDVTKDNRQYCTKCNISRTVTCSHKFEVFKELTVSRTNNITREQTVAQYVYVLRCSNCGEIKEKRIDRWD